MGIDISQTHTIEVGYDEFCGALAAHDLQPLWKMAKWLFPEIALVRGRQRIQEQAYRRAFQARAFRPDNPVSMVGRKLCTGARQSCARIG